MFFKEEYKNVDIKVYIYNVISCFRGEFKFFDYV